MNRATLLPGEPPVRVGALFALSGAAASYGISGQRGVQLAAEELNAAGGILGRRVEVLVEDERTPEEAVATVRRLVSQERVDFLLGIDSSAVAEAVVPILPELQRVLMVTHAATVRIIEDLFNPYVFRCSLAGHQNARAGALVTPVYYRRWATIGPDYSFGHLSWKYFSQYLRALRTDVELAPRGFFHPPGAEDLRPWIREALCAVPDAIWVSSWGRDLVRLVRQAKELKAFDRCAFFMELGGALEVLEELGDEMPTGLWVGTRYWFLWSNLDANRRFVEAYFQRYGHYPSYNAQNAYTGLRLLALAAERAGTLDAEALIQALEGLRWEAPMGSIYLRPEDHQGLANAIWGQTRASSEYPFHILDPMWVFEGSRITPPPAVKGQGAAAGGL